MLSIVAIRVCKLKTIAVAGLLFYDHPILVLNQNIEFDDSEKHAVYIGE